MNNDDQKLVLTVAERAHKGQSLSAALFLMADRMAVKHTGHSGWFDILTLVSENVVCFSDSSREIFNQVFHDEIAGKLTEDTQTVIQASDRFTGTRQCAWCLQNLKDSLEKLHIQSPENPSDVYCSAKCYHFYLGSQSKCTTDGKPPVDPKLPGAPGPIGSDGQHSRYWVLCEAERKKGFVRPLRRAYLHKVCGCMTEMGLALCETYARDPGYYGSTFCAYCQVHRPVSEFIWDEDGETVGI